MCNRARNGKAWAPKGVSLTLQHITRDRAEPWLQADETAGKRGYANRATPVTARSNRERPGAHRRGAAPGRSARSERGVERVTRRLGNEILRVRIEAKLGHLRLAERDGAGRPQSRNAGVVVLGDRVWHRCAAVGGLNISDVDEVFVCDRHANESGERHVWVAEMLGDATVGSFGVGDRRVGSHRNE